MNAAEMNTATYTIDARVSIDDVERALRRYAKRVVAVGHDEPTWQHVVEGKRVVLTISGVPAISNLVVAVCDVLRDDDNQPHTLMRTFPGQGDVDLTRFRDADLRCDHCGQRRYRVQTYIVRDPDSDALRMVGSTCVDEYADREGTLRLWAALADLNAAFAAWEDLGGGDDPDDFGGGGGWYRDFGVRDYTAAACCAIRHYGWRKSAEPEPTKEAAWGIVTARAGDDAPRIEQRDYTAADAAIAWAWDQLEAAQRSDSEYLYTLATLAHQSVAPLRFRGIVASLPFAHQRQQARDAERAAARADVVQEPVAADGTRLRDLAVTVIDTRSFEGAYGSTLMIKMRDADGHALTWFASSYPDVTIGAAYTITGTVKGYDAQRGETKLTRCKIAPA